MTIAKHAEEKNNTHVIKVQAYITSALQHNFKKLTKLQLYEAHKNGVNLKLVFGIYIFKSAQYDCREFISEL